MRKGVSIRLPEGVLSAARGRAKRQHRTLTNYIESVMQRDLRTNAVDVEPEARGKPLVSRVLAALRALRAELERLGVVHAAIFGSVARGEERPDSDIDILVEVDPSVIRSIFAYGAIQQALEGWIGRKVDVAGSDRLRPGVAAAAESEQVLAF